MDAADDIDLSSLQSLRSPLSEFFLDSLPNHMPGSSNDLTNFGIFPEDEAARAVANIQNAQLDIVSARSSYSNLFEDEWGSTDGIQVQLLFQYTTTHPAHSLPPPCCSCPSLSTNPLASPPLGCNQKESSSTSPILTRALK